MSPHMLREGKESYEGCWPGLLPDTAGHGAGAGGEELRGRCRHGRSHHVTACVYQPAPAGAPNQEANG